MKTLRYIILLALTFNGLHAQIPVNSESMPDYFFYKAGHMYCSTDAKEEQLMESRRFKNGMIVHPDGTFKKLNKKPQQLLSGEYLDMDGSVFKTKSDLDLQLDRHRSALSKEYLLFQNGEVIHVKNGSSSILEDKITLQNGTRIHPNGLCQLKTGTKLNLHEGECMDMHGKKYSTIWSFHDKMEKEKDISKD